MALDTTRTYTLTERTASKLRCPECNARLALTWRRARESGRSEDLFTIAKTSCPNKCAYRMQDIE